MFNVVRTMATKVSGGPIELCIREKLTSQLSPVVLEIRNDSWKHASHHGLRPEANTTESHFKIDIVSEAFQGKSQPARHRMIYSILDDEIKNKGVHALQMKTKTPTEANK